MNRVRPEPDDDFQSVASQDSALRPEVAEPESEGSSDTGVEIGVRVRPPDCPCGRGPMTERVVSREDSAQRAWAQRFECMWCPRTANAYPRDAFGAPRILCFFERLDEESDVENPGRWCAYCDMRTPEAEMSAEAAFQGASRRWRCLTCFKVYVTVGNRLVR